MPLKILMLHGYTQSGPLFRAKTRALEKNLQKAFAASHGGVSLYYLTAPHVLSGADIPNWDPTSATIGSTALIGSTGGSNSADIIAETRARIESDPDVYGWWLRRGDSYVGLEKGFEAVAECLIDQGPFDGVLGFSQGGAMAGMVASLLEEPFKPREEAFEANHREGVGMAFPASFLKADSSRIHPPLRFAVSYSGFASANAEQKAFYDPKIKTPMLHVIGSLDTVVAESRSLALVNACEGEKRVVHHPGGHFVPSSQREYVNALISFIRDVIDQGSQPVKKVEQSVEDMDLPF